MPSLRAKRIAVLGGGPIGLEAALAAATAGHDVQLFERGQVGASVRDWGFVRLFSPWGLDRSPLGLSTLLTLGLEAAPEATCPTGTELVERYLLPLSRSPRLAGRVHEHHRVVQVGREGLLKTELVGGARDRHPFRVLVEGPEGERVVRADVVLDCTGTYGNPRALGDGNLPALGERALAERIDYALADIAGRERGRFAGRRVLVIGAGHSAATALAALATIEETQVVWVVRRAEGDPLALHDPDPLPERSRLSRLANAFARGEHPRIACRRPATVERLRPAGEAIEAELRVDGRSETHRVDRIVAHVGHRPDRSIHRELQVHECYASHAPMRLAVALFEAGSTDCLSQPRAGGSSLENPEPGFFIVGAKSYGRGSNFLLRTGHEQVADVLARI